MLFSLPQNVHIQIDKYFRHGNACFKGLDCTAYTKQHMTQIDFTRNSQERFAGTRVNDQEATQTKHMHILSRRNFCRPPAASHDRVREGPTKLFQEKSAWGHDHKTPHACFKGLDCTAYTKQHMTQIDFTRNSPIKNKGAAAGN